MDTVEDKRKVIIIGAGIAGLAAAIRLRLYGWPVSVFEQNDKPGGKIGEFSKEGFRFDTGPSLFTLPSLVDDLFRLAGKTPQDHFTYYQLKSGTWYFYEDGTIIKPGPQKEDLVEAVADQTHEEPETIRNFLEKSREKYEITEPVFLASSLHRKSTYLRKSTFKRFLKLPRLETFKTMARANQQQFEDQRVQQLFNRYATFNGSNPFLTPATFNVIPHLEHNLGAFWPEGGMYRIVNALYQLAEDLGVQFHFNTGVSRINLENRRTTGIQLNDGTNVQGSTVVSNMDVHATYRYLLPAKEWASRFLNQQRSTSALIFYWGVQGDFPELDVHNILFAQDYQKEFNALFHDTNIPDDPTVYLFVSSKANSTDAPEGCENWYVMINAPWDNGQDWDTVIQKAKNHILQKIYRLTGRNVQPLIQTEAIRGPQNLEAETSAYLGSLYGNSANNLLAAFLRHPNFSPSIKGLYFCGGTVHPGGGIPLCLLSAKITSEIVQSDWHKNAL